MGAWCFQCITAHAIHVLDSASLAIFSGSILSHFRGFCCVCDFSVVTCSTSYAIAADEMACGLRPDTYRHNCPNSAHITKSHAKDALGENADLKFGTYSEKLCLNLSVDDMLLQIVFHRTPAHLNSPTT